MSSSNDANSAWGAIIIIALVLFGIGKCSDDVENRKYQRELAKQEQIRQANIKKGQKEVYKFIERMNINLYNKINIIVKERDNAHKKIANLNSLLNRHPSKSQIINNALNEWKQLKINLNESIQKIYKEVEETYIVYTINELQGGKAFEGKADQLNKIADHAIEESRITSNIIRNASAK